MENFVFECKTRIIFGKDTEGRVGAEVKPHSGKILLVAGGGSIKKSGLYDRVTKSLKDAGVEYVEFSGAQPNPRLKLVHKGIETCRANGVTFILAVGGGSAIDTAKAIALGVPYKGDVWDFYIGKAQPAGALPVGVVLTFPAAGSEASIFTVITNEETSQKIGYGSEYARPVFAILNPELSYTLPPYQTACGCVDIMLHTLERYFSHTKEVDFVDRMCEALLKTMVDKSARVLKDPHNYALRADIMWMGAISHNGLLDTGRVTDWASHAIEHELSAIYDVTHGAGLAVVFPAWCKYVYKHNLGRFVQFAVRVMNVEQDFENPERTAMEGIEAIERLFAEIGAPTRLSQLNIDDKRWDEMAAKCTANDTAKIGNLLPLGKRDVVNIFKLCR